MKKELIYLPKTFSLVAALALMVGCNRSSDSSATGGTGDSQARSSDTVREPDNTGRNVRDRSDATLTPGDQGSSDADREVTRGIRRAITANDQLSTTTKNIKIITTDGKVTLRGPVNSEHEKSLIDALVKQQPGVTSVDDQLEAKATKQ
jgi:osmotically-inducible protein OsmY